MRSALIVTGVLVMCMAIAPSTRADPIPTDSIYQLRVKLTDPSGKHIGLDVWRGHPTLIAMVYTTCTSLCPLIVEEIRRVESALPAAARERTRVFLISLDPRKDDSAALREFVALHHIDTARWLVATPASEDVRSIAALLAVRFRASSNGQLAHNAVITALDAQGRPTAQLEGLGKDASPLIAALAADAPSAKR